MPPAWQADSLTLSYLVSPVHTRGQVANRNGMRVEFLPPRTDKNKAKKKKNDFPTDTSTLMRKECEVLQTEGF